MSLKHLIYILAALLVNTIGIHAQCPLPSNWDEDIRAIRCNAAPDFNCKADEYTQYSPAILMLGLKACGYKGRTEWGQMLVSDAFSLVIMSGVTQGLKHVVSRQRPDGNRHSFPSGHTGTAFLTATMLHKEYGWRSPWWSIGGYTVAAFTGISRIMNDRHWMSDIVTGAAIGIGSVHLGYYLSDLIFKGKYINPAYEPPVLTYDSSKKHYVAEMFFGRRFILGGSDGFIDGQRVVRGGTAGLSTDIPVTPGIGVTARLSANSFTYAGGITSNMYSAAAGGFYNIHFGRRFEFQAKGLVGPAYKTHRISAVFNLSTALSFMLDDNFKIKAFADYETIGHSKGTWLHSAIIGWSTAWVW